MDETDKKILSMLQKNGRASLKKIADETFLSSPAVSARIARLEREAVITGYHASVNPAKLGCQIVAFISTAVTAASQPHFLREMEECLNVLECSLVSGEYSVLMKAVFSNQADFDHFTEKLRRYGKTETQIVLSTPFIAEKIPFFAEKGKEEGEPFSA